jgi:hypothetical protein
VEVDNDGEHVECIGAESEDEARCLADLLVKGWAVCHIFDVASIQSASAMLSTMGTGEN